MDTERIIVILLLIAILLSVVTLVITLSTDVVVQQSAMSEDMSTASVVLEIVRDPARGALT